MGPKTFYYLDTTQVKDLHAQASEELEPKEIETEELQTTDKGIKGAFKFVEPKYEKTKSVQTKKRYEVEATPATMYNKVEQYLFSQTDVSFGVEDFEYDESAIEEFRSMCGEMHTKFKFAIPDELQKSFTADRMRGFALEAARRLSETSGYVAIQAEFAISSLAEVPCTLTFAHPMDRHLRPDDVKMSLQITCDDGCLTPAGKTVFTAGNSVKITAVGKVVRWDSQRGSLVISPIAIY